MVNTEHITADFMRAILQSEIRKYVGEYKRFKPASIADLTCFSEDAVKKVVNGDSTPCLHRILQLLSSIDSSVLINSILLEPMGYTGARRIVTNTHCPHKILSQKLQRASKLAEALEDGCIDHIERPEIIKEFKQEIADLTEFVSELEAK